MLLGSVSSMRTTLKNNSRKKEKQHFKNQKVHSHNPKSKLDKLKEIKATPEQIAQIRKKIRKQQRKYILFVTIIFLLIGLLSLLIYKIQY